VTAVGHGLTTYSDVTLNICVSGASSTDSDLPKRLSLRIPEIVNFRNRKACGCRIGAWNGAYCGVNIAPMTYGLPEVTTRNPVA